MSLPRRAMLEMGLEECCYVCDAPDEPKTNRCKLCINSHRLLMKKIDNLNDLNPIKGLARELISHTRNKNNNVKKKKIIKNFEEIIEEQKKNKNYEINQNMEEIKEFVEKVPKVTPKKLGRTNPNKKIKKIDLNDRLGEEIKDLELKKKRDEKYKILDELDEFLNN
ncbi:MAG: hypothetical protein CMA27_05790 [Euryarchaeota archaeon]|nr:hypothetical protein [Euryarchaeota archaeon]